MTPIVFSGALLLVITLTMVDDAALPSVSERALASLGWIAAALLVLVRGHIAGMPVRDCLRAGVVIYIVITVATLGRPVLLMDQLLTAEVKAQTRGRRLAGLTAFLVTIVVWVIWGGDVVRAWS